jgi:hypothetical protein
MLRVKRPAQRRYTGWLIIGRFLAGRDLDGDRRTNATFWQHADRDLTTHGRAGPWAHKRHAERAAWRIGILTAMIAALYGLTVAHRLTVWLLGIGLIIGTIVGTYRLVIGIRNWRHTRRIVAPLYSTLAPLAGHPSGDHHARYLKVPRDFASNDNAKVRLNLSPLWEGTINQQKAVSTLIARRLNGDWNAAWYPHAIPPYMEMMHAPKPPDEVRFTDFRRYMDASEPNIIPLGLGTSRSLQSIDLDKEAPHTALSMGTGAGKTSLMALIIAYLINKGVERIDVINTKRAGYAWCKNLPGVYVHDTMSTQIEAIHNVRMLMESRNDALLTNDSLRFSRHVLIIEEQNSWIDYAKQYWEDKRQELDQKERQNMSKRNPAISDIGFILFQGRQSCVNVISLFQRMSARAAGGGDMRDQYGAVIIARSSPQAWKILVGTTPVPKEIRSTRAGRGMFIMNGEAHPVQLAYITRDEAIEYALATGRITGGPGSPISDSGNERFTLREIAESNIIPISYGALRKAKQRDKEFPAAMNGGYTESEMKTWYQNRPGNRRAA